MDMAGEVLAAKRNPQRPGISRALGLRARADGLSIVSQTTMAEEPYLGSPAYAQVCHAVACTPTHFPPASPLSFQVRSPTSPHGVPDAPNWEHQETRQRIPKPSRDAASGRAPQPSERTSRRAEFCPSMYGMRLALWVSAIARDFQRI